MSKLGSLDHQWEAGNITDIAADGAVIVSAWSEETERLIRVLDRADREWFFSDDHDVCIRCRGVIETQPSSWHWVPRFVFVEAEGVQCQECCEADPDGYADVLSMHPNASEDIAVDPLGVSFEGVEGWEVLPPRTVSHRSTVDVNEAETIRELLGLGTHDGLTYVVHPDRRDAYETTFSIAVRTADDIG